MCPSHGIVEMTKIVPLLVAAALIAACTQDHSGVPMPEKKPVRLELHDDVRVDNYFWLRERENPDVIAYLEAENAYADKMTAADAGHAEHLVR